MKLSSAQKQALDPHFSCWVEASAGTGKTKVLTDRVLSLLLSGAAVSDIVCLTFTKAAGAEMANRLRYRLYQWATLPRHILRRELEDFLGSSFKEGHLDKAKQLFLSILNSAHGIRIQTIHGFCQSLLKTFPLEAGLLPHFKIMSDVEKKQLLEESYEQLWELLEEEEIKLLTNHLSEIQFYEFLDFFLEHKENLLHVSSSELIENLSKDFGLSNSSKLNVEEFFQHSFKIDPAILSFNKASVADVKICHTFLKFEQATLEEKINGFSEYSLLFLTAEGTLRKRIFSKAVQEAFPHVAHIMESEAKNILALYEERVKKRIFERSALLMQIAQKFLRIYEEIKSHKVWLDYDDLVIYTRNLLKKSHIKPWILEKLDYTLKHILIDEAQDTSQVQWDLILALIEEFYAENVQDRPRTLFVVGDLKQSIYSFQGASPIAFEKAKKAFQKLPRHRVITLSTSYRSTPAILQFVDHLFKSSVFQHSQSNSFHQISRHGAPGMVEIWPLVTIEKTEEVEGWNVAETQHTDHNPRRKLAIKIASVISEWLQKGEILHSKSRLLEPRDIMILVRRRDIFMEELVRALKIKGVPVTGLDRMILTDQLAVKDLLCLCDVVLLPDDDLSLSTLLKSPFFGVSEEEIFHLCQNRKDQTLWQYMQGSFACEKIVARLLDWQTAASKRSPYSFFNWILTAQEGRKRLLERLGPEIDDILEEFLSVCQEYEKNHGMHLQCFIWWVRQQNIEVKRSLEQTEENQVRIMTVHGAKGLQAPVVFLPDTTQIPMSRSSLYWNDSPPFLVWTDKESRKIPPLESLIKKDQELQEYYRLLYVALTRAEDRLYICGWEGHKNIHPQSWYSLIQAGLKEIGEVIEIPEMGEGCRYGHLVYVSKEEISAPSFKPFIPLPHWIKEPWIEEKESQIAPSLTERADALVSSAQKEKGVTIHKILQWAVHAEEGHRKVLVKKYIQALSLSKEEKEKIKAAVEAVISHTDFDRFFNKKTRTEVPIHGWIENNHIRVILDVLTIFDTEKKIYIVDYKTGAFLEKYRMSPPMSYLKQMSLYKRLVQEIYPDYEVVSALLWTEIGWIQKL